MNECTKKENGCSIDMCDGLKIAWSLGFVEDVLRSSQLKETGEKIRRVAIQLPKKQGKIAELYFCPFCGSDIDTSDYGFGEKK